MPDAFSQPADTSRPVQPEPDQGAGDIRFKWLTKEDLTDATIADIVDLLNEVARNERNMGFSAELRSPEEIERIAQALRGDLNSGHILTAERGGRIIGTVALAPCGLPARRHVGEIKRCVIARAERGRIMLRAWGIMKERCREIGVDLLVIDVRTDYPRTLNLWRKLGFKDFGRLPRYARMDSRDIDGVFLYHDLKPTDEQT